MILRALGIGHTGVNPLRGPRELPPEGMVNAHQESALRSRYALEHVFAQKPEPRHRS